MEAQDWKEKHIQLLSNGDVDGAIRLKQRHMPDKLYKYFNLDKFRKEKLEGLVMNYVWISGVRNQNDVYDSVVYYDQAKVSRNITRQNFDELAKRITDQASFSAEELQIIKDANDPMEALAENLIEKHPEQAERIRIVMVYLREYMKEHEDAALMMFNERARSSLSITCFSECYDSPSMWERYAGSHQGYCVEYNFAELPIADHRKRCMNPVSYSDQRFDATAFMTGDVQAVSLMAMIASLHKGMGWLPEREWRLVIPGGMVASDTNYMMPAAKAIYLGMSIAEADLQEIVSIASAKKIPVYKMETSLNSLRMIPHIYP